MGTQSAQPFDLRFKILIFGLVLLALLCILKMTTEEVGSILLYNYINNSSNRKVSHIHIMSIP